MHAAGMFDGVACLILSALQECTQVYTCKGTWTCWFVVFLRTWTEHMFCSSPLLHVLDLFIWIVVCVRSVIKQVCVSLQLKYKPTNLITTVDCFHSVEIKIVADAYGLSWQKWWTCVAAFCLIFDVYIIFYSFVRVCTFVIHMS